MADYREIQVPISDQFPNISLALFFCPECKAPCKGVTRTHPYDRLSHVVQCSDTGCATTWILCCRQCETQRIHIRDNLQFSLHRKRCTTRKKLAEGITIESKKRLMVKPLRVAEESARATTPTKVSIPSINQTNIPARNSAAPLAENANSPTVLEKPTEGAERNMSEKDSLEEMERLGLIMPNLFTADDLVKPDFTKFNGEYNQRYFQEESRGRGAAYLVSMSSFKNFDPMVKIDSREIKLQLDIARLVNTMSRNQKDIFGCILGQVMESATRRSQAVSCSPDLRYQFPEIPRSGEDIRRLYIDGKFALLNNVPRPVATMLTTHAHVTVFDCLADFLGHGIPCRSIPSIEWFKSQVELQAKKRKIDVSSDFMTTRYACVLIW